MSLITTKKYILQRGRILILPVEWLKKAKEIEKVGLNHVVGALPSCFLGLFVCLYPFLNYVPLWYLSMYSLF